MCHYLTLPVNGRNYVSETERGAGLGLISDPNT